MTKPLSFGGLRALLDEVFEQLPDPRTGDNVQYRLADVVWGAFGVFFLQSPSFLAYQRDMQRRTGRNNAQSLFGIRQIPSDPQIRNLLDPLDPALLRAPFWRVLERLMADAAVARTFDVGGGWLCALDGTQYFGSSKIHCPQCTVSHYGATPCYAHTALIPVLAKPGSPHVIVLAPEFICPQDGADKQDCERQAANRWVRRNGGYFTGRRVTILADDLHCHQPFCTLLRAQQLDFILTCKPESHPTLYEEVALLERLGAVNERQERVWTGQGYEQWHYRFVNQVPLREPPAALSVNWCELTITQEADQETIYHNTFVTNWPLTAQTVADTVAAGRTRWKVENEGYNVLKQHGYHLEHNYGHGQQHLAMVIVMLALLAFLLHTALDLGDPAYQRLRAELGPRRTFFDDLRTLTRYLWFPSWEQLLAFMMAGLDLAPN